MKSFRQLHPNFETYDDTRYYTNEVPTGMASAFCGLITKHSKNADQLKSAVNIILSHIPDEVTQNWGWDFLINDLRDAVKRISENKFHKFMDAVAEVANDFGDSFVTDLNDELDELDFGYRLESQSHASFFFGPERFEWVLRDDQASQTSEVINEAITQARDICQQTIEHLKQIKQHLQSDSLRSRKDAVRDAMSAMEAFTKELTGCNEIGDATKKLTDEGVWGPKWIVKDGLSTWNRLHDEHPDIRHGHPTETEMPVGEALYCIERILAFIVYLSRRKRELGR